MLSGPAILRISVLLLIAGALAALVQFLMPSTPPTPVVTEPPPPAREAPAPMTAPEPAPVEPPASPPQYQPPAKAEAPADRARMPADALAFPPPAPAQMPTPRGEAEIAQAESTAGPRAFAILDLNTATAAELNRLQGGGSIGRAIVAKRPYASVDQLLSKRVLSRAVYDRIKDQVTVR